MANKKTRPGKYLKRSSNRNKKESSHLRSAFPRKEQDSPVPPQGSDRELFRMVRLMCDNVPDMIWAKDLKKRFIFANKAICQKLLNAKSTDEPVGKTDMFFAQRERASHARNLSYHTFGEICRDSDAIVMKERKPQRFEEFGNVQGKFLYLDVYKAPFLDERGRMIGTVGSGRDVTKEKQMQKEHLKILEELKKSESKYRILFETCTDAIFLQPSEGPIIDCNKAACEMFGYSKKEMLKFSAVDLVPKKNQTRFRQGFKKMREAGEILAATYGQKKTGEIFPCVVNARHAEIEGELMTVAFVSDISQSKKAEEALQESKRFLSSIFSSIQDGISILDKEFRIIQVNPAMEKWYADAMPLVGKKCYAAFHDRSRTCKVCPSRQTMKTGKPAMKLSP